MDFEHPGIRVPDFSFNSPLASKAMALERLRGNLPSDLAHLPVLMELGELYRLMSSIVSARIEGNRTTVIEAIEGVRTLTRGEDTGPRPAAMPGRGDALQEILHLEDATRLIDESITVGTPLTHALIRELHLLATHDLLREGDDHPGSYRVREVAILQSRHTPPLASLVHAHMTDLLDFANEDTPPHMQLVRMAIAHHRFVWIHPFANGNGRVARLFSYAMIRSYGFAPEVEYQTVNPTTVFGADRQGYYDHLAAADSLRDDDLVAWAEFVLGGLLHDMEAMHSLTQPDSIAGLIRDAVDSARRSGQLTAQDAAVLATVAHGHPFKAGELEPAIGLDAPGRSHVVSSLVGRDLLRRTRNGGRIYRIRLSPNALTPFILGQLEQRGMLPAILSDPPSHS